MTQSLISYDCFNCIITGHLDWFLWDELVSIYWQNLVQRTNLHALNNGQHMHVNVKGYMHKADCLSMCVCCIAVGSLWWNRRSLHGGQCGRTSGFTVKNNNEPRTLPKQGFRDVRVCERACMWNFLHIVCSSVMNNCSHYYLPSVSSLKRSGWEPVKVGTMLHCAIACGALCWH